MLRGSVIQQSGDVIEAMIGLAPAALGRSLQASDDYGITLARIFFAEMTGTALLVLMGAGVLANCTLTKAPGASEASWLLISFGWALGIFCGVIAAGQSGAHLNPAVTLGLVIKEGLAAGRSNDAVFVNSIVITPGSFFTYIAGQLTGAFVGACLAWAAYKKHFDAHGRLEDCKPATMRGCFCTAPAIRDYAWNLVTEIIGSFVLIFTIFSFDNEGSGWAAKLGPVSVMFVLLAVATALGGPTGFALNPARDLMPRLAHTILPIPNKCDGDWYYAWVPIVGPLIGGCIAGLLGYIYYDLL